MIVKWRGKPVFIRARTDEEIEQATSVAMGELRDPHEPKGQLLRELMKRHKTYSIEDIHVCSKSSKVVVELTSSSPTNSPARKSAKAGSNGNGNGAKGSSGTTTSTPKAMHSLTFTDDGLVCNFVPYCLQAPTF